MNYTAYLISPQNEKFEVDIDAETPEEAKVKARRENPSCRVAQILKTIRTAE